MVDGNSSSNKQNGPFVHSQEDRIVAKLNGSVIEGDKDEIQTLVYQLQNEIDALKTDLELIEEIDDCVVQLSCDCCDFEETYRSVRKMRDYNATPEDHVDHPDYDCQLENVTVEAVCPQHGRIPIEHGYCDSCRSDQRTMVGL